MSDRIGFLCMNGWAGFRASEVVVVGETPKKYRIRALKPTRLAGKNRMLQEGETALVPKWAVSFEGRDK